MSDDESFRITCPREVDPLNERVAQLDAACGHYPPSDRAVFIAGYNALCGQEMSGSRILEICCGRGELAVGMARAFPGAKMIANDRYPEAGKFIHEARERGEVPNLEYECGDALDLEPHADSSLDLVFGQAALHHLAHDIPAVRREYSRVLRPGGRLIFIFEPLGHNPVYAMIRAWRVSRAQMGDESNVFVGTLKEIARNFSTCEVQVFNLLGYPLKSFRAPGVKGVASMLHKVDAAIIAAMPGLAPSAANFNVIFTK